MPEAAECAGRTPVSVGKPVCIRVCNSVMSVCHVALLRFCVMFAFYERASVCGRQREAEYPGSDADPVLEHFQSITLHRDIIRVKQE